MRFHAFARVWLAILSLVQVFPERTRAESSEQSFLSGTLLVGTPVLSSGTGTLGYTSGIVPLAIGGFVGGALTTTGYAALYFLLVRSTRNSAILGRESSDQSTRGWATDGGGAGRGRFADAMERLELLRAHQGEARDLLAHGQGPEAGSPELQGLVVEVDASAARCATAAPDRGTSQRALLVLASQQWDESLLQRFDQMGDFGEVRACVL